MMLKTYFLVIALLFGFASSGRCDTIDFWHVFYNKMKIKEYVEFSPVNEIVIQADSVKRGDSIAVHYFRDTPCHNCPTSLIVEDEQGTVLLKNSGIGTLTPIALSVNDLLAIRKKMSKNRSMRVFFSEEKQTPKRLLFRLEVQ
jgi:hypothetical protein